MTFSLPVGLPSGRGVPVGSPVMWYADKMPYAPLLDAWTRAQRQQDTTGLRPILCYADDDHPRSLDLAEIDAVDLGPAMEQAWHDDRRRRLAWRAEPSAPPAIPEDLAEFIEPWEDDPGPPFDRWPGLAPATLSSGVDPDEAARAVFTRLLNEAGGMSLGLVRAARSADIPAVIGWRAEAPLPLLCALLRSWEDRFGARVLAAIGSTLYVSVANPPRDRRQADHIALEHLLTTADNIVDDPPTPFPEYAASLVDAPLWSFWWD
ncbi:DUF4253 domain-containing protein [Streptomyces sp. NBC_00659]|uniref:DUF4253 domain-containing protein n=1 Tax=Streptomyces sp. NBC_00659 TaxID=2903669 RepID=UPI002E2F70FD|nr:DUF4253 domain-containing protein [Streptomyces sp. NBC_00659]